MVNSNNVCTQHTSSTRFSRLRRLELSTQKYRNMFVDDIFAPGSYSVSPDYSRIGNLTCSNETLAQATTRGYILVEINSRMSSGLRSTTWLCYFFSTILLDLEGLVHILYRTRSIPKQKISRPTSKISTIPRVSHIQQLTIHPFPPITYQVEKKKHRQFFI